MKNIVIWFIGSNSSGKTTQAKMLHKALGTKAPETLITEEIKVTVFGDTISHVGIVGNNQCTGTDTLSTKAAIRASYLQALEHSTIVILDGIMATGQWYDMIREADVNIMVFLMHYNSPEENFERVRMRRMMKKKGVQINDLDPKTKENLTNKIGTFKRLFDKVADKCEVAKIFDATSESTIIHEEILEALNNFVTD